MTAVFDKSSSEGKAMCVMMVLANWADQNGFVIYRRKTERTLAAIAAKAHTTTRTVTETIAKMWEAGELWTESGGRGAGDINEYRLCLPGLETEDEKDAGIDFRPGWRRKPSKPQDVAAAPGTEAEPDPDMGAGENGKLEETSTSLQTPEKLEVSADKLEVSSHKLEVSAAHIDNNNNQFTSPLPPSGKAGDPPAPPDGGRTPASASNPDEPREVERFKTVLLAQFGDAKFRSWFAELRLEKVGDGLAPTFSTPSPVARDILEQRYQQYLERAWAAVNRLAEAPRVKLVARKPDPKPRYSIEEGEEPSAQKPKRRRRRRAA